MDKENCSFFWIKGVLINGYPVVFHFAQYQSRPKGTSRVDATSSETYLQM